MPHIPEIPHFFPYSDIQPITACSIQSITNKNEQRFAALILGLELSDITAYYEPGKIITPPELRKNCKLFTIPDFLLIAGFNAYLYEVGTEPRTSSGKLKREKAAQRRTLMTTGLPVAIIGSPELQKLEQLFTTQLPHAVLEMVLSLTNE